MHHPDTIHEKIPHTLPRGVYLLPSMFTLANIFCGFYAMIIAINPNVNLTSGYVFKKAAILIILAGIFDALDGRIARMTNSTSSFGAQLDSIADVISFGLAPGFLAYCWSLKYYQRMGWLPVFLFLACGCIRLARFNVLADINFNSKRYFIGLPIPAAAGYIAVMILFQPDVPCQGIDSFLMLIVMYALSLLMVSKFRFRSFKDIELRHRRPVGTLFFMVILLIIILHEPVAMLLVLGTMYILSGPLSYVLPKQTIRLFQKLDRFLLGVKVLDDDDDMHFGTEETSAENMESIQPDDEISPVKDSSA